MKTEFDITLTEKDMYRFSMYHAYSGTHGILSALLAVLIFALAYRNKDVAGMGYTVMYIAFGIVFLLYLPVTLYFQAKKQLKSSEVLRNALHYVVDEEGIHTSQNEAAADLPWEQIYKVISTKSNVLVYSNRIHAYVIPREQIADQYEMFYKIAKAKLPKYRFKMK